MGLIIRPNGLGPWRSKYGFEEGEGLDRHGAPGAGNTTEENFCTCSIHDERVTRRFDAPKGVAPVCGHCHARLRREGEIADALGTPDGNRCLPVTHPERGSPAVDRMVRVGPSPGIVAAKEA